MIGQRRPVKKKGPKSAMGNHIFRCSDDLWATSILTAQERSEVLSDVIRRALEEYVATGGEGE